MTREDLIETMARAYGAKWGPRASTLDAELVRQATTWRRYVAEMETALAAIEAAGCAVVPVVATVSMIRKADTALDFWKEANGLAQMSLKESFVPLHQKHAIRYAAMIAASPFAKETGQ